MSSGPIDLKALSSPRREEIAEQSPRVTQSPHSTQSPRDGISSPRGTQSRVDDLARNMLTRSGHALLISPRRIVSPIGVAESPERLKLFGKTYIDGEARQLFQEALNRGDNRELLAEILELHRRCTYERTILVKAWGLSIERLLKLDPSIREIA